jgi:hypothetical protein
MKLFIFLLFHNFLYIIKCTEDGIFDNSALTSPADTNVSSCIFIKTEHFVQQSMDASARMHLSVETLFQTILRNMKSLKSIEPQLVSTVNNVWYTEGPFRNIFSFSQSEEDDFSRSSSICTQHLYLKNGNSSVCKYRNTIRFNDLECSILLGSLFHFNEWHNDTFVSMMKNIDENVIYTTMYISDGRRIKFFPINNELPTCIVKIDLDYLEIWRNLYEATATIFANYEYLLETFFPKALCQNLKFQYPIDIVNNFPLYDKFPKLLAKFLNAHLKIPATCILLKHEASGRPMPSFFDEPLQLFSRIFESVPNYSRNRVKRDSFSRFFEWVFGDASTRIKTLEYARRKDLKMQNFLLDKSNLTDLAVRHDEEILTNLYRDVEIEKYLVQDLILKLDLERLSHNFHTQFDISLNKIRSFHSNHQNLLLEFRQAFEHDLKQITSCVRGETFCFPQHKNLHCTADCYLSTSDNFYVNFQLLSYTKLEIHHASCLHTLAGHVSILDNRMLVKNKTHYTSINKEISIPLHCSEQTLENNIECKPYFKKSNEESILQCRDNEIYATGNISFLNPKLQSTGLSFVPSIIQKINFPINLKNKQLFSDEICGSGQDSLNLPRRNFKTFLKVSPTFLLNRDVINSSSFEINFIHKTLKNLQKIKPQEIIKIAQSGTFLLSCFISILIFISCLSVCFCPTLFIGMLQCILTSIVKLFTYILEKLIHVMHLAASMLVQMYRDRVGARMNNDLPAPGVQPEMQNMINENVEVVSPISEMSAASFVSREPQPDISNESATRRALRFINLPLRSPMLIRSERPSQSERDHLAASAPFQPPLYRDLPGTPKRLF